MKTVLRVLILGLFAAVFTSTATLTFAQDPCADLDANKALYQKFLDNYQSNNKTEINTAITAANDYVQKYGSCTEYKAQVDYLKAAPASLKERIKQIDAAALQAAKQKRYQAFNVALKGKDIDALYRSGAAILSGEPNLIDVVLVLGYAGVDQALKQPPVDTHNNETIKYAKMAISKLNSGATSKSYGALQYSFQSKGNAIGWMNYGIGQIMFQRMKMKEQALPYLYNAAQANSETKKQPGLYGTFGDYYLEKVIKLGVQRGLLDPKDKANFDKIDNFLGMEKAYAERGADAYARAFSLAKASKTATPAYKKVLFDNLKKLHTFRFQKADEPTDDNADVKINAYVATVVAQPMPNPSSAVTPIIEKKPEPAETTESAPNGTSRNRTVSTKKPGNR